MHVGLVSYGDLEQTSGGYRYDRKLVAALEERGDEVDVIALPRPDADDSDPNASADPDANADDSSTSVSIEGTESSIRARLDRPFDILLQDELCHPSLVDHNPHLEAPERIVALVHLLRSADPAVPDSAAQSLERRYLESVDAAICTSEFTRDRTTELSPLPTAVVPPAGRHEGAAVSTATIEDRVHQDPLRLAFVGTLVPRKNLETLVEALERVDRQVEWHLTVVGDCDTDPEYARTIRERVDMAGLTTRVTFAGHVSDAELESILERAHVLAVPSRYEGFGMAYLEAMEYGVVPIASRVGGAREFITDSRNGVLVEPDDPSRIADVIAALASDRDQLAALGWRALATAEAHPTWDETMADLRSVLVRWLEADESSVPSIDRDGEGAGE